MSVCLSARILQFGSYFHEIRYLIIFRKSVEKIQVSFKYGKIIGHNNVNSQLDATVTKFIDNYNQAQHVWGYNFAHYIL